MTIVYRFVVRRAADGAIYFSISYGAFIYDDFLETIGM
jgi:hypothetical protein